MIGVRSANTPMQVSAKSVSVQEILPWRDQYRAEMNCQIVHDNMHDRAGWTQSYVLEVAGAPAGYGSILIGGPWTGTRTVFEFYLIPGRRNHAFALFEALLAASDATGLEVQSNDALITVMLHTFARQVRAENIVFRDALMTAHSIEGAVFRRRGESAAEWIVERDGVEAASGGILYHYNRPYGDIYMEVAESFRQLGFGSFIVQELKRVCYELGSVPAARCNPQNVASRRTLQKAGFVPYANILVGTLER